MENVKRVGVTGASGFVGSALVARLRERGDAVLAITRRPEETHFPKDVSVRQVDLVAGQAPDIAAAIDGLDAVVHLAGESVAGRWTTRKKLAIHDSRTVSTRNIVQAIRACERPPRILVCASASGYYGSRGDDVLVESSQPGTDFLAQVCVDWEREAQRAEELGARVVCLRQGLVLAPHGGALAQMRPAFAAGAGGPLGSGAQWWPWISLADDVELAAFALDREGARGPINAVAPDVTTNARFSRALGHALRRPSLVLTPGLALRALLGEFAGSLLGSQLMLPARAEDLGFVWRHPSLEHALLDMLEPSGGRKPATQRFESAVEIAASPAAAFDFSSRAAHLGALTPPEFDFRILVDATEMGRGATIEHVVRVHGVRLRWKSLIAKWEPPMRFVDYQLRGPYQLWRHEHGFEPQSDGVLVRDAIEYSLPVGPLSDPALPAVREDLGRIFAYRRARLSELFAGDAGG